MISTADVTEELGRRICRRLGWASWTKEGNFSASPRSRHERPGRRQLRAGDGINITRAWQTDAGVLSWRKPLSRLLADGNVPALASFGPELPADFDAEDVDLSRI